MPGKAEHQELDSYLRANIAAALEVLGKCATGIDVNLRFNSPTAFEPTPEVAIFDLLGITLVSTHGLVHIHGHHSGEYSWFSTLT